MLKIHFLLSDSVLDNANSYSLISGVYGTARPVATSTAPNVFLTKSLLLIVGLEQDICAPCSRINTGTNDTVVYKFLNEEEEK